MAKQVRTRSKFKTGHRARKRVSVVIPTPVGGNHADRRKAARAAAREEAKRHEALMASQAAEKAAREAEVAELAERVDAVMLDCAEPEVIQ